MAAVPEGVPLAFFFTELEFDEFFSDREGGPAAPRPIAGPAVDPIAVNLGLESPGVAEVVFSLCAFAGQSSVKCFGLDPRVNSAVTTREFAYDNGYSERSPPSKWFRMQRLASDIQEAADALFTHCGWLGSGLDTIVVGRATYLGLSWSPLPPTDRVGSTLLGRYLGNASGYCPRRFHPSYNRLAGLIWRFLCEKHPRGDYFHALNLERRTPTHDSRVAHLARQTPIPIPLPLPPSELTPEASLRRRNEILTVGLYPRARFWARAPELQFTEEYPATIEEWLTRYQNDLMRQAHGRWRTRTLEGEERGSDDWV